jgi:hypothetical protein
MEFDDPLMDATTREVMPAVFRKYRREIFLFIDSAFHCGGKKVASRRIQVYRPRALLSPEISQTKRPAKA